MAKQNYFKKLKQKFMVIVSMICILCFSAFAFFACNDTESSDYNDGDYTITTEDNGLIANNSFSYVDDYKDFDVKNFPLTAPTSWTKAVDSATSSLVNSGAVDVSADNWKNLLNNLYDDADFFDYLKNKYSFEVIEVKSAINSENTDSVTNEQVKEYVVERLLLGNDDFLGRANVGGDFKAPTRTGTTDNYVYMLNNYLSSVDFGLGTAQKVTSGSSVKLEKNKSYKISVWVKTINLSSNNADGKFGANIRLTNNINSTLQAEYRITDIKCTEWTEYSIYINTDENFNGSFTLIFGLGLGSGNSTITKYFTEGTALFDDIKVEEIEATTIPTGLTTSNLVYGSTEIIDNKAGSNTSFVYNLKLDNSLPTFKNTINFNGGLTKSNIKVNNENITSKYFDPNSNATLTEESGVKKITLNRSSYTLTLTSSDFILENYKNTNDKDILKFAYISFKVKADLSTLGSTGMYVDIVDKLGANSTLRPAAANITASEDGEWTQVGLFIKNNFKNSTRAFDINLVFGPNNLAELSYASQFATGTVELKDFKYYVSDYSADAYITADYEKGEDNPAYKVIKFFESISTSTSLYHGFSEDYKEPTEETTSYALTSAPGNMGAIIYNPTNVSGYNGIVSNHTYVKENVEGVTLETTINDRTGEGNAYGNAGLINTKYVSSYTYGAEITNALSGVNYTADNPLQALMIYNKLEDTYGYIGETQTIDSSSFAKVSVTLRVFGDNAKAFVYLVNTKNENKDIMEFADFTVNTDIVSGVQNGTAISASSNLFMFEVDNTMLTPDGFVTLEFYIGTGNDTKEFRVEVWNGSRDGEEKSQGFVFVKDVEVATSDAFAPTTRWADAFTDSTETNPLFNIDRQSLELYAHQQVLNEDEIAFNKEYPDQAVSYSANYVWAQNKTFIYAIFSSIDAVYNNPYDAIETPEEEATGCVAQSDPSTFWLSFSSILLGAVLILAIIALFIKNVKRRRKYARVEAKSNYKVQSRIKTHKRNQEKLKKANETPVEVEPEEEVIPEEVEELPEEVIEETEEITENKPEEQTLDEYVYGEVQDFGEENKD